MDKVVVKRAGHHTLHLGPQANYFTSIYTMKYGRKKRNPPHNIAQGIVEAHNKWWLSLLLLCLYFSVNWKAEGKNDGEFFYTNLTLKILDFFWSWGLRTYREQS